MLTSESSAEHLTFEASRCCMYISIVHAYEYGTVLFLKEASYVYNTRIRMRR